ncbi:hypothetical protein [Variovorax durovernensis]
MASCNGCHASQEHYDRETNSKLKSSFRPAHAGIFLPARSLHRQRRQGATEWTGSGMRLRASAIFLAMEKASDIGKPTVPIDLIGPDHWPRSRRGNGRTAKVIAVIVGGIAAAGVIAYRFFGVGR